MYFNRSFTHRDAGCAMGTASTLSCLRDGVQKGVGHQEVTTVGCVARTGKPGCCGCSQLGPHGVWGK